MQTGRLLVVLLIYALAVPGCESSNDADVSGTVTVDGTPVEVGSITFLPADGKSPTAGGKIENGKYSVRVPLGTMKVAIRYPKAAGTKKLYNTPDSPIGTIWKEVLPARFNEKTELALEVKSGRNNKDWELTAK
jgi:hypothetical protein